MRRLVTSVRFEAEAVVVEFDEIWRNGLVRKQMLSIPLDGDYMDEVMAVQNAVEELIDDALEDAAAVPPLSEDELRDLLTDEADDSGDGITFGG